MAIVHLTGRLHEAEVNGSYDTLLTSPEDRLRVQVKGFVADMYRYSGAANIVIARGGATALAELAVQGKPSIIVPNPLLTGGHQVKNTAALAKDGAIVELTVDQIQQELRLSSVVSDLLDNPDKMAELTRQIAHFARPDAAKQIAGMLLQTARFKQMEADSKV
jgi:UDP-N-acetylglucosamine--N-acetylmuramyl-(pentapeptide) pyrophosphoryl-undecaprenol N-acetylglucosamine transferase